MVTELLDNKLVSSFSQLELWPHDNDVKEEEIDKYGDLYVIGSIWLSGLKTALLGTDFTFVPVVKAASPPPQPQKPPPMKYTDLPVYQCPHFEYKDFVESKDKCPDANVKLMRRFLLPYVSVCREKAVGLYCNALCTSKAICDSTREAVNESNKNFKAFMRDSENEKIRRAVVAASAGLGFMLGIGKGIPKRLFYTAAGAAAGGALCYPKETDEAFRNFTYYTGKALLGFVNWTCGKDFSWRERIPCKDDMPEPTGKIVPQCPKKK